MNRNERYFTQKPSKLKQILEQRRGEGIQDQNLPEFSSLKIENQMDAYKSSIKGSMNSKLPQFTAENKTKSTSRDLSYTALAMSSNNSETNSITKQKNLSCHIGVSKLGEHNGSPLPPVFPNFLPSANNLSNSINQNQQAPSNLNYSNNSSFTNGSQYKDNQLRIANNTQNTAHNNTNMQTINNANAPNNTQNNNYNNSIQNNTHITKQVYFTQSSMTNNSTHSVPNSKVPTENMYINQSPRTVRNIPKSSNNLLNERNFLPRHSSLLNGQQQTTNPAYNGRPSTPQNNHHMKDRSSSAKSRPSQNHSGHGNQEFHHLYFGQTPPQNFSATKDNYNNGYGKPMNTYSCKNSSRSNSINHNMNNTHVISNYPYYPQNSSNPSSPHGHMNMYGVPPNRNQLMKHGHHHNLQHVAYCYYEELWTPLTDKLLFESNQFNPLNRTFDMPADLLEMETPSLNRILGQGAYGVVIKVRYRDPNRRKKPEQFLAIKLISNDHFKCRGLGRQLEKEIKCHKKCNHQNILRCYASYETDTHSFLILEGMTQSLQRLAGRLDEGLIMYFCQQLLQALVYLHSNHIIHRDVKLDNILWNADNIIKLSDFGWCAETINGHPHDVSGSFPYMAPEILTGIEQTNKVDIWSFGCCIFELFFGIQLFDLQKKVPHNKASINDWNRAEMQIHHKGKFYMKIDTTFKQSNGKYSTQAMNFIKDMLIINPTKRPSAIAALNHPWFTQSRLHSKSPLNTSSGTSYLNGSSRVSPEYSGGTHAEMMPGKSGGGNDVH